MCTCYSLHTIVDLFLCYVCRMSFFPVQHLSQYPSPTNSASRHQLHLTPLYALHSSSISPFSFRQWCRTIEVGYQLPKPSPSRIHILYLASLLFYLYLVGGEGSILCKLRMKWRIRFDGFGAFWWKILLFQLLGIPLDQHLEIVCLAFPLCSSSVYQDLYSAM